MRQGGPNNRRPRGRHHGGGGHSNHGSHGNHGGNSGGNPNRDNRPRSAASLRHQTFDSNCIDVRVRGNAWQVHEKYQALARDAQSSGDRVAAEHYLQHAEHYYRIIEAINEATAAEQRNRPPQQQGPYGQQPDVPNNYYGTDGQAAQPAAANPDNAGNVAPAAAAPAEAQVQRTQQPSPFFPPEETDEQDGPQPLVARR